MDCVRCRSKLLAPSGEGPASARMQRREVLLRVSDQLLSAPTFKGDEKDSRRPTRDAVSFFFVSSFPNSMHVCSRRRVRPNPSSRSSDRNTVDVPTLRSKEMRLTGLAAAEVAVTYDELAASHTNGVKTVLRSSRMTVVEAGNSFLASRRCGASKAQKEMKRRKEREGQVASG